MPKRTDLHSILIIGSGPIVIGQACEFDYSGTQACRVLREEGYRVILANSNPATIMTDPDFADATYIEPLTWEVLAAIIEREQPDAVLPTLGGQTGLNIAMELFERGLIGVPGTPEMIGANAEAIATAEDRALFKAGDDRDRSRGAAVGHRPHARPGRVRSSSRSACRSSSGRPTSSADAAPASHRPPRSSNDSPRPASTPARSARSSSRSRSPAGRSTSSRSCVTAPTTA